MRNRKKLLDGFPLVVSADDGAPRALALFRVQEIANDTARERKAFDLYRAARRMGYESSDARSRIAQKMKLSSHDISSYIACGRVAHERRQAIAAAFKAGKPIEQIADLIRSPLPKIKRGRRPGSTSKSQRAKANLR